MKLPQPIAEAVQPLFEVLPLDAAMPELCPKSGASAEHIALIAKLLTEPEIAARPALQSALWLYVDELDRSHSISQDIDDATGSYWHGIMHRREGDFPNAHYWFRKVGSHPAIKELAGYDPRAFIDEAGESYPTNPSSLVELQRAEWANLFVWCAHHT